MAAMSVKDFAQSVGTREAEAAAVRMAEAGRWRAQARVRNECTAEGVAWIIAIAALSAKFSDFPDRVSLASGNGYRSGVVITLENGLWRVGEQKGAVGHHDLGTVTPIHSSIASQVLPAMGILHGAEAMMALAAQAEWPDRPSDFRATLDAVLERIPRHTALASMAVGDSVMRSLRNFREPMSPEYADIWVKAVGSRYPIDSLVADSSIVGVTISPALVLAASIRHHVFLDALLKNGANREACSPDDRRTAFIVASWHLDMAACVRLARAGCHTGAMDGLDENAAHHAAARAGSRPGEVLEMLRYLDRQGVPLDHPNFHRMTALDIVLDNLADAGTDDNQAWQARDRELLREWASSRLEGDQCRPAR